MKRFLCSFTAIEPANPEHFTTSSAVASIPLELSSTLISYREYTVGAVIRIDQLPRVHRWRCQSIRSVTRSVPREASTLWSATASTSLEARCTWFSDLAYAAGGIDHVG